MTTPDPASMLKDKIAAVEAQMRARLREIRATFDHAGDKGTSTEDSFRTFLRQYLPRRLAVGHGEVVDRQGRRSRQTDVVIATEDHPFTFTEVLPGLFFIEGVCGVGEIKTNLTATELEKALESSSQFKRMEAELGSAYRGSTLYLRNASAHGLPGSSWRSSLNSHFRRL